MPRIPRSKLQAGWFHCINRGVDRRLIFEDELDYMNFDRRLNALARSHQISVRAYCLMPNHWHIVLRCERIRDMSEFFRQLLNWHTHYYRSKYTKIGYGPIYQGRYKSFEIKDESALEAICIYVEANPVRANLVKETSAWKWTSARGQSRDCPLAMQL